jgi:hypothetical protein
LCILLVLGALGAVILTVSAARLGSSDSLQARLEAERIRRAYADLMRSAAISAARTDAFAYNPPTFTFTGQSWAVDLAEVTVPFPADALITPRYALGDGRDQGPPGSLPWLASNSEALVAQGHLMLSRPGSANTATLTRDFTFETRLWRIPAGAVRLLNSSQGLTAVDGLALEVDGVAVLVKGTCPDGLAATTIFTDGAATRITDGADPAARLGQLYDNLAYPGTVEVSFDSLDDPPTGFATATQAGVRYAAIDLGAYHGPPVIAVKGAAASAGLVVIGSATAQSPLVICAPGPVLLAGTDRRYLTLATSSRQVSFRSQATFDAGQGTWVLPAAGAAAVDFIWTGHIFLAAVDPRLDLEEDWTGAHATLQGSLHLLGGGFATTGGGAGTLGRLTVSAPDWTAVGNPFGSDLRQESFLVCLPR